METETGRCGYKESEEERGREIGKETKRHTEIEIWREGVVERGRDKRKRGGGYRERERERERKREKKKRQRERERERGTDQGLGLQKEVSNPEP